MNVLVTGSDGQLGQEIQNLVGKKTNYFFTDRQLVDITNKYEILNFVSKNNISVIINCAAYTNVNESENNKKLAMKINSYGVKNLVEVCEIKKIKIIHFSTDYVYDGINFNPIKENESINPVNYYGLSKRDGEIHLQKSKCRSIIIRTSWLYSQFGDNFVKKIIDIGSNKKKINVINDQYGCPTYAKDLAELTIDIIKKNLNFFENSIICNYSNEGYTTWYDFAKKIFELKNIDSKIVPVKSFFDNNSAKRSKFLITDKSKIKRLFNIKIPHWEKSLKKYLKTIKI